MWGLGYRVDMSDKLVNPHEAFFKQYLSRSAVKVNKAELAQKLLTY